MEKIKELILLIKVKICSVINKMEMPINKDSLIDTKLVRHVYKVEKERVKVFYCMIRGKSYLINYDIRLENWFNVSEIEIKRSSSMNMNFRIVSINNLEDYDYYVNERRRKDKAS